MRVAATSHADAVQCEGTCAYRTEGSSLALVVGEALVDDAQRPVPLELSRRHPQQAETSAHLDDDLAAGAPGLEVAVGLGGLLEREHAVDDRLQRAFFDEWHE